MLQKLETRIHKICGNLAFTAVHLLKRMQACDKTRQVVHNLITHRGL